MNAILPAVECPLLHFWCRRDSRILPPPSPIYGTGGPNFRPGGKYYVDTRGSGGSRVRSLLRTVPSPSKDFSPLQLCSYITVIPHPPKLVEDWGVIYRGFELGDYLILFYKKSSNQDYTYVRKHIRQMPLHEVPVFVGPISR